MNRKQSNIVKILIIIFCEILIISSLIISLKYSQKNNPKEQEINNNENEIVIENNPEEEKLKTIYNENKAINLDYVGQIYFESKLIDLPFVHGSYNDKYMRTDWKTGSYDVGGSIFLEATNDILNDQNTIIYGHNFDLSLDPSSTKMFSPLRALMDKNNYENNKIIYLFLGDRIRKYEIVYVYKAKVVQDGDIQYLADNEPFYDTKNFNEIEFTDYINKVKEREYYDTGKTILYSDKMLTLQTCIDYEIDKLIINAKLIEETMINS